MKSKYNISDTEREIMEMLWKQQRGMKQSELLALFAAEGKEWKRQTLNTFLSRLEGKELVKRENRIVEAAYTEEEYNLLQMTENIEKMYSGKLSEFVLAFTGSSKISKQEAQRLREIIAKAETEN